MAFPMAINLLIYAAVFYLAFTGLSGSLDFLSSDIWYESLLYYFIVGAGLALFFFFMLFTFVALANIIGSPFYEILSEKTAALLGTAEKAAKKTIGQNIKVFSISLFGGVKRIFLFVSSQVLLFIISLFPLIGVTFITLLNIFITAWFLAMEFLDFELDRREWNFDRKLAAFKKNKWPMLGFGLGIMVGALIPVFNLLFLPVCVMAGSMFYKEFLHKK